MSEIERRKIRMEPDWGLRPPLWWGSTELESSETQKRIDEVVRSGLGRWSGQPATNSERAGPDRWPITTLLMDRLNAWADEWERLAEGEVLAGNERASKDEWTGWRARGLVLAQDLQRELGEGFEVWYCDLTTRQSHWVNE